MNKKNYFSGKVINREHTSFENLLDVFTLNQAFRLALRKSKSGFYDESKAIYKSILDRFPQNKRAIKELKALSREKTVGSSPVGDLPSEKVHDLIQLYKQGKFEQVLEKTKPLLKLYPSSAVGYNIQGASLAGLKHFASAISSYQQALKIMPNFAEVFSNMSTAQRDSGDLKGAIKSCEQALAIKPDYAEAHYNLGNAVYDTGDLEAALKNYKAALTIKPDFAEAHSNFASVLIDNGDFKNAIESCEQALRYKPDYSKANINLVNALKGLNSPHFRFTEFNPTLADQILQMLENARYVRPKDIAPATLNLLKCEPTIKKFLELHLNDRLSEFLYEIIIRLCEVPLFLKLMSVCAIADLHYEKALRALRSAILEIIFSNSIPRKILKFQSALALHCFTNEYVYWVTEEENLKLIKLKNYLTEMVLTGQQPDLHLLLCLASYEPLFKFEWARELKVRSEIKSVLIRQLIEPKEELRFKNDIKLLKDIRDEISSQVRKQYEESPYPRWVNVGIPEKPLEIEKVLKNLKVMVFDHSINKEKNPEILVAGCGTGQHSIGTATRFKNSRVLAIDLSLSSLAYAKRKTEELGITNVDYMQADILDLEKIGRKFDIIESGGVLHHMKKPMVGWQILTNCLKPGGLMNIGLYSKLARKHITATRLEIMKQGIEANNYEMRKLRKKIMNSEKRHHKKVLASTDFYTLSSVRDLLFHTQEHQFTLSEIRSSLSELGLAFCGFETENLLQDFKLTNSSELDCYDLNKWEVYEETNSSAFAGMYQFWCQKIL